MSAVMFVAFIYSLPLSHVAQHVQPSNQQHILQFVGHCLNCQGMWIWVYKIFNA